MGKAPVHTFHTKLPNKGLAKTKKKTLVDALRCTYVLNVVLLSNAEGILNSPKLYFPGAGRAAVVPRKRPRLRAELAVMPDAILGTPYRSTGTRPGQHMLSHPEPP